MDAADSPYMQGQLPNYDEIPYIYSNLSSFLTLDTLDRHTSVVLRRPIDCTNAGLLAKSVEKRDERAKAMLKDYMKKNYKVLPLQCSFQ